MYVSAPDGTKGIIPRDNVVQAIQMGGHILQDSAAYAIKNPSTPITQEDSAMGGLARIPGNLWGGAKAVASAPFTNPATGDVDLRNPGENIVGNLWIKPALESAEHVSNVAAQHGQTGTLKEAAGRAIAAVPAVGPWVMGTDQQKGLAERNSAGGILAEGLGTLLASEGASQGIAKAVRAVPSPADAVAERTAQSVRASVPEAVQLPTPAITGAEKVFRAAAPWGSDPQFRSNVYAAAGDLAEIGRATNIAEAKGGIIQPDMRVRATVSAINDHLREMYQGERAPQIARNADAQVVPQFDEDATAGLEYLSRNAGKAADRALAAKALSADSMSLGDVDALARTVNRELSPLRGMTPQELANAEGNSKRLGSLQALDESLSDSIASELANRGEGGISQYERRYAALSQIRDQLQRRMNMTELQRRNPVTTLAGLLQKPSIAGASQAATANVNIGRMLQQGLSELADSGLQANRAIGRGAPAVRGLLGPGAIQLPQGEAINPRSGLYPAASATVRDAHTGRMRRMYVTSPSE